MGMHVWDSLRNFVSMIGTSKDASSHSRFFVNELDRQTLNAMYRGDWIARKVVKAPAEDATRDWRMWQAGKDQIEKLEEFEKKFDLQRKLKKVLIQARLYGGAAFVMGIEQGKPSDELKVDSLGADSLKFLHVMSKYELTASGRIYDPLSPWFGQPEYYEVNSVPTGATRIDNNALSPQARIHPSRVIPFHGEELPDLSIANDGWAADSALQAVSDALKQVATVSGGIATLIHDSKVDVINIPGLSKILSDDKSSAKLVERFGAANEVKSMVNSLLLDAEEKWTRLQTNFGGLPDILRTYLLLAAGASDIPVSRLLGQMSSNLGAKSEGEADARSYYDRIMTEQQTVISPALRPLDEVIIRASLGKDDANIFYIWPPLWQMDESEKATIANQKATTTKIYIDSGIINEDALRIAVVNQLNEDGTYPGLDAAIDQEGAIPPDPPPMDPAMIAAMAGGGGAVPGQQPAQIGAPKKPPPLKFDPKTGKPIADAALISEMFDWAIAQGFKPSEKPQPRKRKPKAT